MNTAATVLALLCLFLCTGTLATAVLNEPLLEDAPGGLRHLQEALGNELMADAQDAVKQSQYAAAGMMNTAFTRVEGVQTLATNSAEAAAAIHTAQRIARADARLAGVVSTTTKNTLKANTEAAAATATAMNVKALDAATPNKNPLKKVVIKVAKFATNVNAAIQTKEAAAVAAKGEKRVKRATAKNADSHSDALRDAADAAAHAANRAAIKTDIADNTVTSTDCYNSTTTTTML